MNLCYEFNQRATFIFDDQKVLLMGDLKREVARLMPIKYIETRIKTDTVRSIFLILYLQPSAT